MPSDRDDGDDRSWPEYRRLVLAELQRIDRMVAELNKKMDENGSIRDKAIRQLEIELAMIKTKVLIFGALAGFAGTGILQLVVRFAASH